MRGAGGVGGGARRRLGAWLRAAAIAVLAIGSLESIPRAHAAAANPSSKDKRNAGAPQARAAAAAPEPEPAGAAPSSPEPTPSTEAASPDVAQAAQDLERGAALLGSKKGTKRLAPAEAAFTSAIDRLSPTAESLGPEGRRVLARALDGRAQTRLLRGRPKAADGDFERLVALEPAYEPDPAVTPRRALDRFHKIRAPRVGFITLKVDPPDATIIWNGRDLGPAAGFAAGRPVLAGPFTVRARRDCYEERDAAGEVAAREKKEIVLTLDAFARIVRFETNPAGFDVDIDGTFVGKTAAPETPPEDPGMEADTPGGGAPDSGAPAANGVLELACVPAGDHAYSVRRDCYADVRGTLSVDIDLLDRSPIVIPVIAPNKRETRLSVTSDTPGAVLFLEGVPAGPLPIRDRTLCAPRITMEARVKDHVIWRQTRDLEDGPLAIAADRRPTLALVMAVASGHAPHAAVAERVVGRVDSLRSFSAGAPGSVPPPDLRLEVRPSADNEPGRPIELHLVPLSVPQRAIDVVCFQEDGACLDRFFDELDAAWSQASTPPPGTLAAPLPRVIAKTLLDAAVLLPGPERNTSLMTLASALIGSGAYREALELSLERPLWADGVAGPASRGSAFFLTGICHRALGEDAAARAAFARAAADPGATLWTDDLPVAPLARLMLPPPG